MLKIVKSKRFDKDLKLAKARNLDLSKIGYVVTKIANQEELEPKYKNHPLKGKYNGCWECHIKPDWILIYQIKSDELLLLLIRTGTHSDLF